MHYFWGRVVADGGELDDAINAAGQEEKANTGVGIGFVLLLAGLFLLGHGEVRALVGLTLILIGAPVFIWGCMNYAEGKGHSKWVGIVGLLGIIGLVVLIVLPDQHKLAS